MNSMSLTPAMKAALVIAYDEKRDPGAIRMAGGHITAPRVRSGDGLVKRGLAEWHGSAFTNRLYGTRCREFFLTSAGIGAAIAIKGGRR